MNLGEILSYIYLKSGKDQFGSYITPDQYNTALEFANYEMLNKYLNKFELTQMVDEDLTPFIKTLGDFDNPAIDIDDNGYAVRPDDYIRYVRVTVAQLVNDDCETASVKNRMVEMLNNDKFNYRITNGLLTPKVENPIGVVQNDKMLVYPSKKFPTVLDNKPFAKLKLTYIREPITPVYGYTVVNDEPIYDPATSVELEWPISVHEDFADLCLKYFAINFRSEFNIQTIDTDKI